MQYCANMGAEKAVNFSFQESQKVSLFAEERKKDENKESKRGVKYRLGHSEEKVK